MAGGQTRSVWRAVEQVTVEHEKAGLDSNRDWIPAFAGTSGGKHFDLRSLGCARDKVRESWFVNRISQE